MTAMIAVVAVAVLGTLALLLDRGTPDRFAAVLETASDAPPPIPTIASAGRAHRLLFLSDGGGSPAAIRLAADVVQEMARGVGLDALVLAVPDDRQARLDAYLAGNGDDADLFADPVIMGGPGMPLLPLLQRVRALNQELGAARSVRVVAADLPNWPPSANVAPAQAVTLWAERDLYMVGVVERRILAREARARVLFLADGLHAMRVPYTVRTGGMAPVAVMPLAALLADRFPGEVWSGLVDPPRAAGRVPRVASLLGTEVWASLAGTGVPFAAAVGRSFGTATEWLRVATPPGVTISIAPDVQLADAWNSWVYLPR